jgi:hypothetical protein
LGVAFVGGIFLNLFKSMRAAWAACQDIPERVQLPWNKTTLEWL